MTQFNRNYWVVNCRQRQSDGYWKVEIEFVTPQTGAGTALSFPDSGISLVSGSIVSATPTTPEPSGSNTYIGQVFVCSGEPIIHASYCKNDTAFQRS